MEPVPEAPRSAVDVGLPITWGRAVPASVYGAAANGAAATRDVTENWPPSPAAANSCTVCPQKLPVVTVAHKLTVTGVVPAKVSDVTGAEQAAPVE